MTAGTSCVHLDLAQRLDQVPDVQRRGQQAGVCPGQASRGADRAAAVPQPSSQGREGARWSPSVTDRKALSEVQPQNGRGQTPMTATPDPSPESIRVGAG